MGKKLPQRALVWIEYNTVNTHQPQGKTGKKKAPTKSVGLLPQVSANSFIINSNITQWTLISQQCMY